MSHELCQLEVHESDVAIHGIPLGALLASWQQGRDQNPTKLSRGRPMRPSGSWSEFVSLLGREAESDLNLYASRQHFARDRDSGPVDGMLPTFLVICICN